MHTPPMRLRALRRHDCLIYAAYGYAPRLFVVYASHKTLFGVGGGGVGTDSVGIYLRLFADGGVCYTPI